MQPHLLDKQVSMESGTENETENDDDHEERDDDVYLKNKQLSTIEKIIIFGLTFSAIVIIVIAFLAKMRLI